MLSARSWRRPFAVAVVVAGGVALGIPGVASAAPASFHHANPLAVQQVDLVSDVAGRAALTDPDLVNPWGLASSPTSPLWVANAGGDTSTLYTAAADTSAAAKVAAVRVTFPDTPELPTGQVFNGGTGFVNTLAGKSGPARFIFSTITGHIEAWAPGVDPNLGNAQTRATVSGASYTGLATATATAGDQLYAANFGQHRIDVFDSSFAQVQTPAWAFKDIFVPRDFAPFGVQAVNGNIFVAYAKVDPKTGRSQDGLGLGIVDEFTADGRFVTRVATAGTLDGPWGMASAPSSWGQLAGDLLIGNFGNGHITAFRPVANGRFFLPVTQLRDSNDKLITIERLWALLPGTATTGGTDAVWFSSGLDQETHGLVGVLRP
jgi:uncharacterized protein (TIGR03118 family)